MGLGERKSPPTLLPTSEGLIFNVEYLNDVRTLLTDFFSSRLIQRGDGQRHFVRQQKRHVCLVRGVRLNESK